MVADRKPDPVEKIFNQRPDYRDPRQMPINIKEVSTLYYFSPKTFACGKEC